MDLSTLFDLESHGPDVFVGVGPRYPWGGLYGGQIVAQALRAAAMTVDTTQPVHSLRAYFIRRGDHTEPIRFEVDRIRNGRSFSTRRVIARQAIGAILNLEASFHAPEESLDVQPIALDPQVPPPDDLTDESWTPAFERRWVPPEHLRPTVGAGRSAAWMRLTGDLGDDPLMHQCWLAYLSDDLPTDSVGAGHPDFGRPHGTTFNASLDHTIWFHRPLRADRWHLHDFTSHGFVGGRGLAIGHIFGADGTHAATVAQEVLMRKPIERQD